MSNEENIESMMTDDNQSAAASGQQSNRRDTAPCQLNTAKRRQLLNTNSNMTKSFPEASSSRVNVIHNKLNSTEGNRKKVTSKSNIDISLSSPEESTDNRTDYDQPSRSYRRLLPDIHDVMDIVDDDDGKVKNKSDDSDDDNNIQVDDGMFRVAGFIDDKGDDLEIDVDILKANCKNSRQKRPFVDLYTTPSQSHDRKDITMLLLESYNSWLKGYNARNKFEQTIVEHALSPPPKQSFADRMKGNSTATAPQENEMHVQLIDIKNSLRLGSENKSVCEEYLNNSTASISSPVSEKTFFKTEQDFPDLCSKTTAVSRELRAPATYSNRSRTNQSPAAASSSNIVLDISTDERWDPNTGAWTSSKKQKPPQQQANNDLNKPNNNEQQKAADEKVQCPICQRSFSVAKVESHAAHCFQFPRETRSNNQDTSSKTVTSSREPPANLNNSVDLTESDEEEWEEVRSKANKRKGCSDEDDLSGTDNVKRPCRKKQ